MMFMTNPSAKRSYHNSIEMICLQNFKVKRRRRRGGQITDNYHRVSCLSSDIMMPTTNSSSSSSHLLYLLFLICIIPFIPQDLNLSNHERRVFPIVSATIAHQYNLTAAAAANNNQTANNQELLLNLVKHNFKTGANANNNNVTSQPAPSGLAPINRPVPPPPPPRIAQHYQTTYACEGNQLDFGCQEGKMIHLVRAIYGRFSLSICNEQGYSNYSVDCASFKAFLVMETRCNKLNNCSVNVSEELFGDPCQGTSKYLEVQYYCYDANNHNNQSQVSAQAPPGHHHHHASSSASHRANPLLLQVQDAAAAAANFGHQQQQQNSHSHSNNNNFAPSATPTFSNDIAHKSPPSQKFAPNSVGGDREQQQQQQQPTDEQQEDLSVIMRPSQDGPSAAAGYCQPQASARNLFWNYTRAGRLAKQNCPEGSLGEASWLCDAERLRFVPAWSPDFSQCRLSWLERLAAQLDRMLESPGKLQQSPEATRAQNEQILKQVLVDLSLMARTKELFGEDLQRIDIMLSQIVQQFRSLMVIYGSLDSWRSPILLGGPRQNGNNFGFLYEDLFRKLANIVSSLFDPSQRSAWLELKQASERQRLELRFLNHLKDAGVLLANVFGSSNQQQLQMQLEPVRQANVFAGFAVINNNGNLDAPFAASPSSSSASSQLIVSSSEDTNELSVQMRQAQSSLNRFASLALNSQQQLEDSDQQQQTLNEFRIHSNVMRELTSKGISRLLVIDVRKPNYSLIKQHLESSAHAYEATNAANGGAGDTNWLSVLDGSQLWTTRVFGVFAIVGENGDVLDGQQAATAAAATNQQQLERNKLLNDLLAQWPISIDFRSLAPPQVAASAYQPHVARACSAVGQHQQPHANNVDELDAGGQSCQTYKVNATSHICRCSRFGFVSLTSLAIQQQQPTGLEPPQWPLNLASDKSSSFSPALDIIGGGGGDSNNQAPSYIGPQGKLGQQQQSVGTWTTIFIVFGLLLLVIFVGAFIINAFIGQTRLNKKPGFFSAAAGGPSHHLHHHHHRDLSGGPTTGPLVDHSLVGGGGGGGDSLLTAAGGPAAAINGSGGTTQTGSIVGLNQAAYQGYKQQSLYAAHLPPLMGGGAMSRRNRWLQWAQLLVRPARWLSSRSKDDQMIHHRVIGSSLSSSGGKTTGSVSYKSTYQNGYTTAGLHQLNHHHHHHHHLQQSHQQQPPLNGSHLPLAPPSSSTSSYVSSSAYYEEIGPGNLTKVNTNQLNTARAQTLVDPFKRSAATIDQQQQQQQPMLASSQHQLHQQLMGQQAALWNQPNATTTISSYPIDQSNNYGGQQVSMMLPVSGGFQQQQQQANKQQIQNNDLNQQQQQQQSSAASSSSASTNLTSSGSTPRHYLFASPTAVNAYKSTISQQQQQATAISHHHHCQQIQFKSQDHRFMPN